MLTKSDFQQAIKDSIAAYPAVAPLYQAGDPRILQHLDAMATMLAMLSAQIETAMSEPFEKVRDATVLADAAMRGIVRKATPARVRIKATNKGNQVFSVESGRTIIDSLGNPYRIETSADIAAGDESTFDAVQLKTVNSVHTVTGSYPFYAIEVQQADDETYLCGIAVSDVNGDYIYRDRYVNVLPDERVFHVEADDRQRVYVRFGYEGVVGMQPKDGAKINLAISYTVGEINPAFGSPFSFEYIGSPHEAYIELKMDAMLLPGQNPPSMSVLRDLARYPSVYDNNAVFLGEFDFLVRRNFPTLRFLSVWNESLEELARGPSLDNINTLFVACLSSAGTENVLTEVNPGSPVAPVVIDDESLTDTQNEIKALILSADDSYKVKFYTPVRSEIGMTITAKIAASYNVAEIKQKITEAVLNEFGEEAVKARRSRNRPLYQNVYALLRAKIAALSSGESDLIVNIIESESIGARPEMWRYVSENSLTVTVQTLNITTPAWGR